MKKLMIGFALAAAAVTPALANSYHSRASSVGAGYGAYAYAPGPDTHAYAYAPGPAYGVPPVFAYGRYQGSDPNPFIRGQLMRDPPNLQH